MLQQPRRRSALTLVELLVVIGIIATLAAIAAVSFPRFAQQETLNRGADMLQGWLLNAKMRAKRDGVPTGIRLFYNQEIGQDNPAQAAAAFDPTHASYIQQPDDFVRGYYIQSSGGNIATFEASAALKTPPTNPPVRVGDYLEVFGSGLLRRIGAVDSNTQLTIDGSSPPLPNFGPYTPPATTPPVPSNYRIIRQPFLIEGETPLVLPEGISILPYQGPTLGSQNVPSRSVGGTPPVTYSEILFGPSGAVIGSGTSSAQIILWVQDNTGTRATLICVQPRTGFIAAHPVNTGGSDPYSFTKDARSSGM